MSLASESPPRAQCPRCQRPQSHCLCALIPQLPSRTRVLILQHPEESRHALNTARLAALGLVNGELQVGEQFARLAPSAIRHHQQQWPLAGAGGNGRYRLRVIAGKQ